MIHIFFADMIKRLPPLPDNEEYVSYNVFSLFTNMPLYDTIDYIIESIYTHKNYTKSVVS